MTVIRTAFLALTQSFENVSVFHLRPPASSRSDLDYAASFHHLPAETPARVMHTVRAGAFGHHALNEIAGMDPSQVRSMMNTLTRSTSAPSLVVLDGVRVAGALSPLAQFPTLVDLDDVLSARYRAWSKLAFDEMPFDLVGTNPGSWTNNLAKRLRVLVPLVLRAEARAVASMERDVAAAATTVSLVSASEARAFEKTHGRPVDVLPMAYPTDIGQSWSWNADPVFDAVFLGRATHLSNLAALNWLGRQVVPALRHRLGRAPRVGVVGEASPSVTEWIESLGLEPLGFVDDLGAVLASTATGVAPQVVGGGMNTKLLDYAARGVPVVGTPHAFSGVLHRDECDWNETGDPAEFAELVVRVRSDRGFAEASAAGCRRHAEAYYRPEAIRARWIASFARTIDTTRELHG
ncbi:MAG: glycosyltransferase [Acidimicrobiales bacterium]